MRLTLLSLCPIVLDMKTTHNTDPGTKMANETTQNLTSLFTTCQDADEAFDAKMSRETMTTKMAASANFDAACDAAEEAFGVTNLRSDIEYGYSIGALLQGM